MRRSMNVHENHECQIMTTATTAGSRLSTLRHRYWRRPHRSTTRRLRMTWETPTATDFRFGFEITMYIAAR
jgi:coenzyme PQQ precursor peptide PqqA